MDEKRASGEKYLLSEVLSLYSGRSRSSKNLADIIGVEDSADPSYQALKTEMDRVNTLDAKTLFAELQEKNRGGERISEYGFNAEVYRSLLLCTMVADFLQETQSAELCAYKLAVMFGDAKSALTYLKASQETVHDACLFSMPEEDGWDIRAWQLFCKNYLIDDAVRNGFALPNAKKINLRELSPEIKLKFKDVKEGDSPRNSKLSALDSDAGKKLLEGIAEIERLQGRYSRWAEDPVAAEIFSKCQSNGNYISENCFNTYLDDIKPELEKNKGSDEIIPPVFIDGNQLGCEGYYVIKLSHGDPKGAVLGYLTACCQSVGREGEACAIYGMMKENSGFYVICKGKIPKDREKTNTTQGIPLKDIVAQTWAWRSKRGDAVSDVLVFDSLEYQPAIPQATLTKLTVALAKECLGKKGIRHVNIGRGGKTPSNLKYKSINDPESLEEYYGYRDSRQQDSLCSDSDSLYADLILGIDKDADIQAKIQSGMTLLDIAIEYGQVEIVKRLLNAGVSVDSMTPILFACANGHLDILILLFEKKHYEDISSDQLTFLLQVACVEGHADVAQLLFQRGATIAFEQDEDFKDELRILYEKGSAGMSQLLFGNDEPPDFGREDGEDKSLLQVVCENGHTEVAKLLLERGETIDFEKKDKRGRALLYVVCENGHAEVAKLLFECGATLNLKDKKDIKELLQRICEKGHAEVAKLLFEKDPYKDMFIKKQEFLLSMAGENGHVEMVKLFLERGVNINAKLKNGKTLLHMACENKHIGLVRFLLAQGANINLLDDDWNTPLHLACKTGDNEIVKLLIQRRADLFVFNKDQYTPMGILFNKMDKQMSELELEQFFKRVIEDQEANPGDPLEVFLSKQLDHIENNETLKSPMHLACEEGDMKAVQSWLKAGGNVNTRFEEGKTPLRVAYENGHVELMRLLLEKGAEPTVSYEVWDRVSRMLGRRVEWHFEEMPLLKVEFNKAKEMRIEIVKLLLEKHVVRDRYEIIQFLRDAFFARRLDIAAMLLEKYPDELKQVIASSTLINEVFRHDYVDGVAWLLENGAQINDKHKTYPLYEMQDLSDDYRMTLLEEAFEKENAEAIALFVKHGASVNVSDQEGNTPLHYVCGMGNVDLVKLMLEKGANVNAVNTEGVTPLHAACGEGHVDVVVALLKAGAKIDLADKDNETALDWARENQYSGIVKLLEAFAEIKNIADPEKRNKLLASFEKTLHEVGSSENVQKQMSDEKTILPSVAASSKSSFLVEKPQQDVASPSAEGVPLGGIRRR